MESENIQDKIQDNIQMILRQTDYSKEQAHLKLIECNHDPLLVIKQFLGITEKKASPIVSVNQEIYRQLRNKLDSSMREYQSRTEKSK
jgi:hypothetical protein